MIFDLRLPIVTIMPLTSLKKSVVYHCTTVVIEYMGPTLPWTYYFLRVMRLILGCFDHYAHTLITRARRVRISLILRSTNGKQNY